LRSNLVLNEGKKNIVTGHRQRNQESHKINGKKTAERGKWGRGTSLRGALTLTRREGRKFFYMAEKQGG